MLVTGKPVYGNSEQEAHCHQTAESQHGHQSQNLHKTVAGQPVVQKASPLHDYKVHLNDIWKQRQHQQQQASEI